MRTPALTIHQPYAELIMRRLKYCENREWPTNHRGKLYIHAGKNKKWWDDIYCIPESECPFGALVGWVTLHDCLPIDQVFKRYPKLEGHEHVNGPFCWLVKNPMRFEVPLEMNGKQGLWYPKIQEEA